ncbi:MAG: DUF438 domain-containing protein [Fibrobacter sp.]|nr:DUF438 domain-containing protein [Fibrobacter sp.]
MQISKGTKVKELLDRYDFMLDFLLGVSPRFKLLKNPVALKTVGSVATLAQAASIAGISPDALVEKVASEIEKRTGTKVNRSDEGKVEGLTDSQARQEVLKDIIRDLHDGADLQSVKKRFQELIRDIDASEISRMEQRLIEEGMPESEVKRLCDVHVQVFKESLEAKDAPVMPEGHPVHTLMLENRASEELMSKIEEIINRIGDAPDSDTYNKNRGDLENLLLSLKKIDLHYLRKENQLFPVLEKHDISGPSQVMWVLHDDIRAMVKNALELLATDKAAEFVVRTRELIQTIRDMIYKEEHILYPLAVEILSSEEWDRVKRGEEEIGYAWIVSPGSVNVSAVEKSPEETSGKMKLDTGFLTVEQVNLMLRHLPVDISFVNENDEVVYYSDTPERIFPRSAGVIGRKVQKCHPPKSVSIVQQILDDFRAGKKDVAEFWIQLHGKFIHIRYFALRDSSSAYRGCLEVSQDVTEIRKLEGEKRLLDY